MRGVTEITPSFLYVSPFQPALPMRGVTRYPQGAPSVARFQPALPMRGVTVQLASAVAHGFISTRTPHAGSDAAVANVSLCCERFQPALPMRGVTRGCGCSRPARRQISTRTPHAGSDAPHSALAVLYDPISTRTPHAGSDEVCLRHFLSLSSFQPALPMRGVTPQRLPASQICRISTRTPHAGSDELSCMFSA